MTLKTQDSKFEPGSGRPTALFLDHKVSLFIEYLLINEDNYRERVTSPAVTKVALTTVLFGKPTSSICLLVK